MMNDIKPKRVHITSLSVRFYLHDGWTLDVLRAHTREPHMEFVLRGFGPDESRDQYYLPEVGTVIDYDRLFKSGHIGDVVGKNSWGELRSMSDLEALKERN